MTMTQSISKKVRRLKKMILKEKLIVLPTKDGLKFSYLTKKQLQNFDCEEGYEKAYELWDKNNEYILTDSKN